jgi:hypothetical protein
MDIIVLRGLSLGFSTFDSKCIYQPHESPACCSGPSWYTGDEYIILGLRKPLY